MPSTLRVGGEPQTIGLRVLGADGGVAAQVPVSIACTSGVQVTTQPMRSDTQGIAFGQIACVAEGTSSCSAIAAVNGQTVAFEQTTEVLCGAPAGDEGAESPATVSVVVSESQSEASADVSSPALVTLLVLDASGAPLANQLVTLSAGRPGDSVQPATARTDAQGRVVVTLTGGTLGQGTIIAQVGAQQTTAAVRFVAGPPDAGHSSITVREAPAVADGSAVNHLDVMVRDSLGNGVPYASVSLTSSASQDVVSPADGLTDISGHFVAALSGIVAGGRTVVATVHTGSFSTAAALVAGVVDAAASTLLLSPNVVTADGVSPSYLTLVARDAYQNAVGNQNVVLSSSVPSDVFAPTPAATEPDGTVLTTLSGTLAGSRTISASLGAITLNQNLTMVPGVPNGGLSALVVASTVQAGSTTPVELSLHDAFDNPIVGQVVTFAGSDSNDQFAPSTLVTDVMGVATSQFSGQLSGPHLIVAHLGAQGSSMSAPIALTPAPVSLVQTSLQVSTTQATDDGLSAIQLMVQAGDVYGNAVPGAVVALALSPNSGTFAPGTGVTDASGRFVTSLTSTVLGQKTITASVAGATLPGTNVAFVGGPPAAAQSLLWAANSNVVADGQAGITLMVRLVDATGNALANQPVAFAVGSGAQASITPASATTDGDGRATAVVRSTQAGSKALSAQSGALWLSANLNFVPGAPSLSQSTLTCAPNYVTADGQAVGTVQIAVRDAFGNFVPTSPITWSTALAGATLTPAAASTDVFGRATTQLRGTVAGTGQVAAVLSPNMILQAPVTFVPGPISPMTSQLVLSPNVQVADGSPVGIVVQLRDALGNTVPSGAVALSTALGQASLSPVSLTTGASGRGTATLSSTLAQLGVLRAQSGNTVLSANVTFVAGPASVSYSTFMASSGTPIADGQQPVTLTVLLKDARQNPVPLGPVLLISSVTTDVFAPASGNTDASGQFVASLAGTVAGQRTVQARVAGLQLQTAAALQAGEPNNIASSLSATPNQVVANNSSTSTVTVILADAFANLVPWRTVSFQSVDGQLALSAASATTDAMGRASVQVRGTVAGSHAVGAVAGSVNATTMVQMLPGVPSLANSTFVTGASTVADGASPIGLTLIVRDIYNNVVPNVAVTLSPTGGASYAPAGGLTDALGRFFSQVTDTQAETINLSATLASGSTIGAQVTFGPGSPNAALSSFSASPNPIPADGNTQSALWLSLVDGQHNPIVGAPVTLSSSDSNDVVSGSQNTDNDGMLTGALTTTVAGSKTVFAAVGGAHPATLSTTLTVVPTSANPNSIVLAVSPNSILADGATQATVIVVGKDTSGNPLTGQTASWAVNKTTAALAAASTVLNSSGTGSTTVSTTALGLVKIQVAVGGATTSVALRGIAGSPNAALSQMSLSPNAPVADGLSALSVAVALRDSFGHPVSGVPLNFFMANGSVPMPGVSTNSQGLASVTATTTTAGPHLVQATSGNFVLQGTATFVPGPIAAAQSLLVLSPNSVLADGSTPVALSVALRDAYGNPVPGQSVAWTASDAHVVVAPAESVTDASGAAQSWAASQWAGQAMLSAAAQGVTLSLPAAFVPGQPNSATSLLALSSNSAVADGATAIAIKTFVRDRFGNSVAYVPVSFACVAPGVQVWPSTAVTDGNGMAMTSVTSTVAGAPTFVASGANISLPVALSFVPGPPDAALSMLTASPNVVVADGLTASSLVVAVEDAYGNAVPNQPVTVVSNLSAATILGPTTTDANGLWQGTITSTVAQGQTLTASLGLVNVQTGITFVAGPASAANSSVTASAATTVANGTSSVNLTVRVKDAQGNAARSQAVTLAVGGTGNGVGALSGTTDSSGQWQTTMTSTVAQSKSLSAAVGGLTVTNTVMFVPGSPSSSLSTVAVQPQQLVADGNTQATVTVVAQDAYGNRIGNQPVSMVALPAGFVLGSSAGTTDVTGTWQTMLASTRSGSPAITAVLGSASVSNFVVFLPGPPAAATSTLTASATSFAADGTSQLTLFTQFNDAFGNAVPNVSVAFGSGTAGDQFSPANANTSLSGALSSAVSSTAVGPHAFSALAGSANLQMIVQAVPGAPSNVASSLSLTPNQVVADGVSLAQAQVIVCDTLGHLIASSPVHVAVSGPGATWTATDGNTDATGHWTAGLTSTVAESKTVTVNLLGTSLTGTVNFVAGPMSNSTSTLTATPSQAVADGNQTIALQLTAKDAQSNEAPGRVVTFSSSGSLNHFIAATGNTDSGGRAASQLMSTKSENKIVAALADGTTVTVPVSFVPGAAYALTSYIARSPNTLVADGSLTTLVLNLLDSQGNPLANQAVTVAVTGTANTLSATSGTTDSQGRFSTVLSSTKAELKSISMEAANVTVTTAVVFTPGPSVASTSTFTVSPNIVVADGNNKALLSATLRDAYGNLTPGVAATFSIDGPGNLLQPQPQSDSTGAVLAMLSSTVAGARAVHVSFSGLTLDGILNFVAGAPSNMASTIVASPNSIAADNVSTSSLAVTLRDAFGNPVPNMPLTFGASGSNFQFAPPSASTDATGYATVVFTGTQAGSKTVTATTPGTTISTTVVLNPGPPSSPNSTIVASPNSIVADGQSSSALAIVVRDAFNNPIYHSPIALSASGLGAIFAAANGNTDVAGQYITQLSATVAELKTISVALVGTSMSTQVQFTPGAVNPQTSTLFATPGQAIADGSQNLALTLTLRDAQNNLVPGVSVTFTASGQMTQFYSATGVTDGNGVLQTTAATTKAQSEIITASAGGTAVNTTITFTPGAVTNGSIALRIQPSSQSADAVTPMVATLFVGDAFGNPIAGQAANFISTVATDSVTQLASTTDANGNLPVALHATASGSRTVTASFGSLSTNAMASIGPGSPNAALSSAVANPNQVVADGVSYSTLVVTVRDRFGNLVPSTYVATALSAGNANSTQFMPAGGYSNGAGVFSTQITSTLAESKGAKATFGGAQANAAVWFVAGAVSPTVSTLVASPNVVVIDGQTQATITLTLRDAQGNPVPGQALTIAASGSSNTFAANSGTSDGNGVWQTTLLSTLEQAEILTASTNSTSVGGTVTFVPGSPNTLLSTLTINPNTLVADNVTTAVLTAVFRDNWGNIIKAGTANWAGAGGNDTYASLSTFLGTGAGSNALRSTLAHTVTPSVHLGAVGLNGTVTFIAGAPSAATSSLVVNPNAPIANGTSAATLTAMINDQFANPIYNQVVTFTVANANVTIPSTTTSAMGVATSTVTSTLAGGRTAKAAAASISMNQNFNFVAGPVVLANSALSATAAAVADNSSPIVFTAKLYDAYANAVPNAQVTLSTNGNAVTISPASGISNAAGTFSANLTSGVVQAYSGLASCQGQNFSFAGNFTLGPPSTVNSTFSASPNTGLALNGNQVSKLTLVLRDAQNRLLPNVPVLMSVPNTLASASPIRGVTSPSGLFGSSLQSTVAGTVLVNAVMPAVSLLAQVTFAAQSPICSGHMLLGGRPGVFQKTNAAQILAKDWNNDGKADLALMASDSGGINIYFNTGGGMFAAPIVLANPQDNAQSMMATDVNGDGNQDLIVASNNNSIIRYLGLGNGTFSTGKTFAANGNVVGLCHGDINKDGYDDVVAVSRQGPTGFSILLGDGAGSYLPPTFYTSTSTALVHCVTGDFNGDSYLDLALTNSSNNTVDIYSGNSGGTFSSVTSYAVGSTPCGANIFTPSPNDIKVADFNKDGVLDLVISNTSTAAGTTSTHLFDACFLNQATISVLIGKGDGTFLPQKLIATDMMPNGLDVVDVDQDGNLDVVVGCGTRSNALESWPVTSAGNNINVFFGAGNGNFSPKQQISFGVSTTSVSVADFDADGFMDLAYSSDQTPVAGIAWGTAARTFASGTLVSLGTTSKNYIIAADFNNDGYADLIGGFVNSGSILYLNDQTGKFSKTALPNSQGSIIGLKGDFNGDGNMDFMNINYYYQNASYYINDGSAHFTYNKLATNSDLLNLGTYGPMNAASGDINNDGLDDVVTLGASRKMYVFLSTGDPNVATLLTFPSIGTVTGACAPVIADVNNDGLKDILFGCDDGFLLLANGNLSYASPIIIARQTNLAALTNSALIDLNADGYLDLVAITSSAISTLINNGSGNFQAPTAVSISGPNPSLVGVLPVDFNLDGLVDLVIGSQAGGFLFAKNTGSGALSVPDRYTGGSWGTFSVADFDHNGLPDVVMCGSQSPTLYLNKGCSP